MEFTGFDRFIISGKVTNVKDSIICNQVDDLKIWICDNSEYGAKEVNIKVSMDFIYNR